MKSSNGPIVSYGLGANYLIINSRPFGIGRLVPNLSMAFDAKNVVVDDASENTSDDRAFRIGWFASLKAPG